MRFTILPNAIILTKARRAVVSISATQLYLCLCNYDAIVPYSNKTEVLQQEYSQLAILPSPHFRRVEKSPANLHPPPPPYLTWRILLTTTSPSSTHPIPLLLHPPHSPPPPIPTPCTSPIHILHPSPPSLLTATSTALIPR